MLPRGLAHKTSIASLAMTFGTRAIAHARGRTRACVRVLMHRCARRLGLECCISSVDIQCRPHTVDHILLTKYNAGPIGCARRAQQLELECRPHRAGNVVLAKYC